MLIRLYRHSPKVLIQIEFSKHMVLYFSRKKESINKL